MKLLQLKPQPGLPVEAFEIRLACILSVYIIFNQVPEVDRIGAVIITHTS